MTTLLRNAFIALAIGLFLFTTSAAQAARDAVITLKDGRVLKGQIVEESDKSVMVLISGIKTPYNRDLIKSIEFVKTPAEEYAERRAKIDDDNLKERAVLARWLYDNKEFKLAKKELDDLAKRDPKNAEVNLLKRIVEEKLKADATVTPDTPTTPGTTPGTTPDAPAAGHIGDLPKDRLTAKQINRIRVLEINEELNPRVSVTFNTFDDFLKKYSEDEAMPKGVDARKLKALKDLEKLKLIMEVGAQEFFEEIVVHDDPPAIRDFRLLHRNYVLSFCATADCHGGAKAGSFFLFASAPTANETVHTNFYILTQSKPKVGYMVDRDYPSKSLLLQFGLPRDKATTPHPDVPGFKPPMLQGDKDRTYQLLLDWISKSLYRPEPKYELQYKIPTLTPAKPEKPAAPAPAAPKPAGS